MPNDGFELLVRDEESVMPIDDVLVGTNDELSLELVFDLLANERRRSILFYLEEHETAIVESLVDHLLAEERGGPVDARSTARRSHLRTELLHSHLPKLADTDVVDFDRTGEFVEYDPPTSFRLFFELATAMENRETR